MENIKLTNSLAQMEATLQANQKTIHENYQQIKDMDKEIQILKKTARKSSDEVVYYYNYVYCR